MKKKYWVLPLIIVMTAVLSYLTYIKCVINSDIAGTYTQLYAYFELGSTKLSIKDFLNPWRFSSIIAYLLNVGGSGSTISVAYLAAWYGIAVFFTLLLVAYKLKNKWMLALAFFILLPYRLTNRYHMVAAFITLFLLWIVQYYQDHRKKWLIFVGAFVALYTVLYTDDRALSVLFVFSTAAVYYLILFLQDKNKHKYLYWLALLVSLGAMVLKVTVILVNLIFDKDIGILGEWGGYGGSEYLTWTDMQTLFDKGIPSFFSAFLRQWNIPIDGGMIQFNSFYWIIRLGLVVLALVALVSRWVKIVKKGIKSLVLLDSLSVVCVTVVTCVNIFNGMMWYYEVDSALMNKYGSVCWFLLVVILIRWLDERCRDGILYRGLTTNIALGIISVVLCIGYGSPFSRNEINEYCENELNWLTEHGEEYRYGLGSYLKTNPITAATNGEYVVCGGWITDGELVRQSDAFYSDGSNYFNFIISDPNNTMTISPENIEEVRGDYIGTYSNTSCIYLYDYDIRWEPKLVMESVGTDYELTDAIEYYFDFPVGTNRIEMTVANSANFDLSITENADVSEVTVNLVDDNKIQVDLVCLQNTRVTFRVARKADELTTIHKIVLKRVRGAVTVYSGEQEQMENEVYLNSGSYVFTFVGEDIDEMEIDWLGDGITVEQLTDGRVRRRYRVEVEAGGTIQYEITGSAQIDRISYENTVLFE